MNDWPFDQITREQAELVYSKRLYAVYIVPSGIVLGYNIDQHPGYEWTTWKSFPQHVILNYHPDQSLLLLSPDVQSYMEKDQWK